MAVYFVTGKLGNGKTLVSVSRLVECVKAGRPIATNIDLDFFKFLPVDNKSLRYMRVPDKPSSIDLEALGNANPTYDEFNNGLLVLDECGTWFNSRNWKDKTRGDLNDWFLHARKLGWDVIFIVQDISLVDSQARTALSECTAFCKRTDKFHVPVIGSIYKFYTGNRLKLPMCHIARVVYGNAPNDPLFDRWIYRGTDIFDFYDTKQCFSSNYSHGCYSHLPPWHQKGRYLKPREDHFMRLTKILWRKFSRPAVGVVGLVLGCALTYAATFKQPEIVQVVKSIDLPIPKPRDLSRYQELKFDGMYSINDKTIFNFKHPSLGRVKSSSDIFKDIMIKQIADCAIELHLDNEVVTVVCDDIPKEPESIAFFQTESLINPVKKLDTPIADSL